jgi:hypothetical protein
MTAAAVTTAVLPPRAAAVAMKTPASTAMAGAQTINNQLTAVMVTAMETATMTATITNPDMGWVKLEIATIKFGG